MRAAKAARVVRAPAAAGAVRVAPLETRIDHGAHPGLESMSPIAPSHTPWGRDGWEREELQAVSEVALCCTDEPWCAERHARAVVFRRKAAASASAAAATLAGAGAGGRAKRRREENRS